MFTDGRPDLTLVLIIGVPLAALLVTLYMKQGS